MHTIMAIFTKDLAEFFLRIKNFGERSTKN
jgi:hypothetical protein